MLSLYRACAEIAGFWSVVSAEAATNWHIDTSSNGPRERKKYMAATISTGEARPHTPLPAFLGATPVRVPQFYESVMEYFLHQSRPFCGRVAFVFKRAFAFQTRIIPYCQLEGFPAP
jgi:hypothetical protein